MDVVILGFIGFDFWGILNLPRKMSTLIRGISDEAGFAVLILRYWNLKPIWLFLIFKKFEFPA